MEREVNYDKINLYISISKYWEHFKLLFLPIMDFIDWLQNYYTNILLHFNFNNRLSEIFDSDWFPFLWNYLCKSSLIKLDDEGGLKTNFYFFAGNNWNHSSALLWSLKMWRTRSAIVCWAGSAWLTLLHIMACFVSSMDPYRQMRIFY